MRKRLLSISQYIIFPAIGIFLVWWQLKSMTATEKAEFNDSLSHANYWLLIPIVSMSILSHISRSMRWKLLLEPLNYNPKLKNVFSVLMIGYLVNSAIPRLGEIIKCTLLARYEKLKVDKLVGTIIVERTFDVLCYFIFIGITVLIQISVLGDYIKEQFKLIRSSTGLPLWAEILMLAAAVILLFFFIKFIFKRFAQNKIIKKISNFIRGIGEGFTTIKNLRHRRSFIIHTFFIWSMYLLQIYVGFASMTGIMHLGIKAACAVLTLSTLAMIITPGGIGSFPIFVGRTLVLYGVASQLGKAYGWLIWGVSIGIVIVVGFGALLLLPYINRNKNEISSIDTGKDIFAG